jgi:hypothetical protein
VTGPSVPPPAKRMVFIDRLRFKVEGWWRKRSFVGTMPPQDDGDAVDFTI